MLEWVSPIPMPQPSFLSQYKPGNETMYVLYEKLAEGLVTRLLVSSE